MKVSKVKRKFCWDDRGALEGLPLYLIILVVIAAVAIIIIFSYLSILRTVELERIEIYVDGEKDPDFVTPGEHEVYVIAIGSDGDKLKDVTITLDGPELNRARKTDSDGRADFGNVEFTSNNTPYEVEVHYSYSGGTLDMPDYETILISTG